MRRALASEHGAELYRQRQPLIEPIFAHTKFNRRIERFPPTRKIGRPNGMAPDHRNTQPAEAPQALARPRPPDGRRR